MACCSSHGKLLPHLKPERASKPRAQSPLRPANRRLPSFCSSLRPSVIPSVHSPPLTWSPPTHHDPSHFLGLPLLGTGLALGVLTQHLGPALPSVMVSLLHGPALWAEAWHHPGEAQGTGE